MSLMSSRLNIPEHQLKKFECTNCHDSVFVPVNGVIFLFDRLKPDDLRPSPAQMWKCLSCGGYLQKLKDGSYGVVTVKRGGGETLSGDEWKEGDSK